MPRRLGVYAGSFDPPTHGHVWMIEQGAALFERLIVAVGTNPDKRYLFSTEDRIEMLRDCTRHLPNIEVQNFTNQFLINFAKSCRARFVLRGIRNAGDYEQERVMRHVNGDLDPEITTLFLMPPRAIAEISSSLVKGLVGPEGWEAVVQSYVTAGVLEKLRRVHGARQTQG